MADGQVRTGPHSQIIGLDMGAASAVANSMGCGASVVAAFLPIAEQEMLKAQRQRAETEES
ncbi:DUF7697 family protein [Magnetococcus sp. PR-3]|uniref:DUF7697 family protein n=1 Tax=Magnetococcus sp. PR-3 TaxID=3120355 RepID=UPI002FCE5226